MYHCGCGRALSSYEGAVEAWDSRRPARGNRAIVGEIGLPASKRARGRETHLLERPPRPGGIVQGKQAHEAQGFNFKSLGFEIGSQNTFSLSTIMHDNITGKRRLCKNLWTG